ncbi:hypothetical protein BDV93DRAFT_563213 [Ceratobasidium sp. AG-I]|nr:hypothetical protein BDV93DRAFT_563213 [Ceratobasidium sp. AG-I]
MSTIAPTPAPAFTAIPVPVPPPIASTVLCPVPGYRQASPYSYGYPPPHIYPAPAAHGYPVTAPHGCSAPSCGYPPPYFSPTLGHGSSYSSGYDPNAPGLAYHWI